MNRIPLLAVLVFAGSTGVQAQHASRLGELRPLVHQQDAPVRQSVQPAQAVRPTSTEKAAPTAQRQLTPQERAELRRQLSEFHRPAGKGS